ncbi:MAG: SoxY-related AACIE arm protein [Methylibium sp.]|uniref:SoxY-related AACIE arm protein n=1 Tax=Methylibium sp. TaxID=2067992 RepID=UPI0018543A8D|nr:SoxY-related AACIE arm protein [Methylibium sp.]MBA3597093.1 SoxY-related AACIE arm protein [Methylibium sp.]
MKRARTHLAQRRGLLAAGLALVPMIWVRQASANKAELDAAVRAFAGAATVQPGRVQLEIAPLVENGNAVPVTVRVESPMSAADHVQRIALFNERNPQREVASFLLGPRAGRAEVSTRIRLATSQQLVALAQMSDGSVWSHRVDVLVTLAACIE